MGGADSSDKPLSRAARWALFCGAGATIALTYVLSTFSVLALLALIGLELLLALALARFGLAGLIAKVIGSHVALIGVLLRSFLLRKGAEYRSQLAPGDAPALFELLRRLCHQAQVAMPREVSIEMSTGAWVRLDGYRRGAGRTILGIGFDLLAGLSQWEIEGVLAHEITHAKVVQRGYKRWLNRGVGRMGQLAEGLYHHVEERRRARTLSEPAPALFRMADNLTRLAARLVAACSRQDEFDADRGAAALCGAGAIRSSLLKMESIEERSARLPWNERVARLQIGEGFSRWVVEELASPDSAGTEPGETLFYKYSSHPSLSDRLAALPPAETNSQRNLSPAIELLAAPDQVAEVLISKIQATVAEEERKDTKRLRKWARKSTMQTRMRPAQSAGVLLIIVGIVFGLGLFFADAMTLGLAVIVCGAIGVGVICYRLGRYRDRLTLAIPEFAVLKSVAQTNIDFTQEQVKALETEIQACVDNRVSKRKKELALAEISYAALHRCDYLKAHVAARLCLQVNGKSIEGVAGLVVAAAGLGNIQQVQEGLRFLHHVTAMSSPSVTWSASWALLLCADWTPAEALLEKCCQQRPDHPTLSLLLALCQSHRGKLQSALLLARRACAVETANAEFSKFLLKLLLKAGYLREARERLQKLEPLIENDSELVIMRVQLALLSREFEEADAWAQRLRQKNPEPNLCLQLAFLHETARQKEKASRFYNEVLANGFYPEALMGLARLEAKAQNKEQARQHLAAALNIDRPLGEKAVGPLPLFHQILGSILALDEPIIGCAAWMAQLNGGKAPRGLENRCLLIYARSQQQAQEMLQALFAKMQPGLPPIPNSCIGWSQAEKERQPDGPVRAGVQGILD